MFPNHVFDGFRYVLMFFGSVLDLVLIEFENCVYMLEAYFRFVRLKHVIAFFRCFCSELGPGSVIIGFSAKKPCRVHQLSSKLAPGKRVL